MELTEQNYYSKEVDKAFLSVSQYKKAFGTYAYKGCEAQMLGELRGEYTPPQSTALLVGSYVDSYFEGTLDEFKTNHPEILKKDGTLKAEYSKADAMIERCKRDKKFMQYMSGQKQVIMTGEICGALFKIKMDSYLEGKAIVDLKTVDDMYKPVYCGRENGKLDFLRARGYDFQLAVYQKIVEENTGKRLPCFIAAVDKKDTPAIEIISLSQAELDGAIAGIDIGIKRIQLLKNGEAEPDKCNRCDYCKETKIITKPISMADLLESE